MLSPNIYQLFKTLSAADPQRIVLETNGGAVTREELAFKVDRLATRFPAGWQRSCIAYYGNDLSDFISVLLLSARQECTLVVFPQNPLFVKKALQETSPLVFTSDEDSRRSLLSFTGYRDALCLHWHGSDHQPQSPQWTPQRHDLVTNPDPAANIVIYTSGTTAQPVGILTGIRSFITNVEDLQAVLPVNTFDRYIVCTSVTTSYGFSLGVILPLILGKTIRYIGFGHPATMAAQVGRDGTNCMIANPAVLVKIAEYPVVVRSLKDAGLVQIISSGAVLPAVCFTVFHQDHGIAVADSYGTSETNGIGLKKGSFTAPVTALASVQIRYDALEEDAGPEQRYRLSVKGPKNMVGSTGATQTTLSADGWIQTADIVTPVSATSFILSGRMSSMVRVNGNRVQAETVENIIERLEGVQEALVYGEPHPTLGEMLCARIVVREGASALTIRSFIAALAPELPPHMIPKKIELVPGIEKNNGKKVRRGIPLP